MKKLISLFLILVLCFSLFACDKNDENPIPEGMQAASDPARLGFSLFVPEAWVVSSYGAIACAYVSNLDTSSVSLVRVELGEVSFENYVKESLAKSKNAVTYLEDGKQVNFGNAKRALSYVYTYSYGEHPFTFMQVLAQAADGATYLFTYSASATDKYEGESFYQSHLSEVTSMMECVLLGEKTDYRTDEVVYETDADGYKLVSDKSVAGFAFYIPPTFTAEISTGIVLAVAEDGTSVSITEATSRGVSVRDYYEGRLKELAVVFDEVTEITPLTECDFSNTQSSVYAEYSYKDGSTVYRVYQVIAVSGGSILNQKGFVMTYTARADLYENHMDELTKMMEKIKF